MIVKELIAALVALDNDTADVFDTDAHPIIGVSKGETAAERSRIYIEAEF